MTTLPKWALGHPLVRNGYRANVAAVIRRPADGALLWCERMDIADSWQFPQGGVDDGETETDALWRELGEELGLPAPRALMDLVAVAEETVNYDFPPRVLERWVRRGRYTWLGQAQRFFLLDFHGDDAAITLEPPPGHHREFRTWCWDDCSRIALGPDFKQPALRAGLDLLGVLSE